MSERKPTGWVEQHAAALVLGLVGVGLGLRVLVAAPTFLNPDEVLNFISADQSTLAGAIQYGMFNPHPPLYYMLLWFWRFLGQSDLMLRVPSILAGVAAIWFTWKWLSELVGRRAGVIGAALMALAPEMIALSAEMRSYIFQVLLLVAALWLLERSIRRRSIASMLLFGLVLCTAVLNHYSAFIIAAILGVYAVFRLARRRPGLRVVAAWAVGQAATLGLSLLLFFTHITKLRGSGMELNARTHWLAESYFRAGTDSILFFPLRQTYAVFKYLFSSPVAGILGLALVLAAVVVVLARRDAAVSSRRWDILVLLVLPFAAVCGTAMAGLHPYGWSRHSFFLFVFAAAGVAYVLATAGDTIRMSRTRFAYVSGGVMTLVLVLVLAVPWNLTARPAGQQYLPPEERRRELIEQAADYVREIAPGCRLVFADQQSRVLLQRYLCRHKGETDWGERYVEYRCAERLIVQPQGVWMMSADEFPGRFEQLGVDYGLRPGEQVCVVFAGWGWNPVHELRESKTVVYPGTRLFGPRVAVFVATVVGNSLERLAQRVAASAGRRFRLVLWPAQYAVGRDSGPVQDLDVDMITYARAFADFQTGRRDFDQSLPILVFWLREPVEPYPPGMARMSSGESYVAEGYSFTLLGQDSSGVVLAYAIDRAGPE